MSNKICPSTPISAIIESEITQSHDLRRPLLAEIGEHFQGTVISFYAAHNHWQSSLNDSDVTMIKDLLVSIGKTSNLIFVIDSPGGDPHAPRELLRYVENILVRTLSHWYQIKQNLRPP